MGGVYTEYLFDKDGNPEAENNRGTANNGWVDSWVDFEGQHIAHFENNGTYFIHSNQVGTAGIVTDWTGAVIQDELHYPWGQVWTTMGTQTEERFAFLHHRDAATGLDPTHYRMYSSDQGRWMSPDPAKNCPHHPENFDRYNYADNNPTNRTDPRGNALYGIELPYIDYGLGLDAQFLPNPEPDGYPPYYIPPPILIPYYGFHLVSTVTCVCYRTTIHPDFGECSYSCNCSNGKRAMEWASYWGTIREACGDVSSCPQILEIEQSYLNLGVFGIAYGTHITHCEP